MFFSRSPRPAHHPLSRENGGVLGAAADGVRQPERAPCPALQLLVGSLERFFAFRFPFPLSPAGYRIHYKQKSGGMSTVSRLNFRLALLQLEYRPPCFTPPSILLSDTPPALLIRPSAKNDHGLPVAQIGGKHAHRSDLALTVTFHAA